VLLTNDGPYDNWQGEYAILLANASGPELLGIVVNQSGAWPNLDSNLEGWRNLVGAARDSGLAVPDPLPSTSVPLSRPDDGDIDSTVPNDSDGARMILDAASRYGTPSRPLAVVTGGRLTDVADAYLLDATLPERVVVVASLGTVEAGGGRMGQPNGEMDPWADNVVVQRFRYVQVSAFYDQLSDVPPARFGELPQSAFGDWIRAKQPSLLDLPEAADQVAIIALGIPGFVRSVARVSPMDATPLELGDAPILEPDAKGQDWLITDCDASRATARFWQLLLADNMR
jgi:hypothetical protein